MALIPHMELPKCGLCMYTYMYTFALKMTRASSRNVGKLFSNHKVVHRESSVLICDLYKYIQCHV